MESIPMSYNYFNEIPTEMDLLAASSIGDLSLVHRLLQEGANVDQSNESGWTALMYASHYGHYNVVKMLIDYGANVNICESAQGRTPLMLAASCGHTRCLEVLITLGAADIEMTDSQGHNAAYYAIHSGHGRNKIIAKLLKIQGKSRSSNSTSSSTNNQSAPSTTGITISSASSSRTRPLTKGRSETSTSANYTGSNCTKPTGRSHGSAISSNKITSTKPDIIISKDNGPILEDSSPFPHGSGHIQNNDSGSYYSPYLPLSRDGSPIGDQYSPITSPFSVNNGLTPQLTFDRLLGKRRLPMGNQLNGQPSHKTYRRDQVSSSSEAGYNLLVSASCSSQQHQQINHQQSTLTSSSSPSSSLSKTTTGSTVPTTNEETIKKSSPGVIGSKLKGPSPSIVSPKCPSEGNQDPRNDTGISSSGGNSGDESSLPPILSDASTSSIFSSSTRSDSGLNRSHSPLPENLDSLLDRIGLSQYSPLFTSHGIDLYCFLTLNEVDFEEIGITLLGHKRKLYMAQLRFRESVEIASTQERFFADWLLSERENLKKENHELKMKLKGVDSITPTTAIYN